MKRGPSTQKKSPSRPKVVRPKAEDSSDSDGEFYEQRKVDRKEERQVERKEERKVERELCKQSTSSDPVETFEFGNRSEESDSELLQQARLTDDPQSSSAKESSSSSRSDAIEVNPYSLKSACTPQSREMKVNKATKAIDNKQIMLSDEEDMKASLLRIRDIETVLQITQKELLRFLFNDSVYECERCKILYKDVKFYVKHMKTHASSKSKELFVCACGFKFKNSERADFNNHLFNARHNLEAYKSTLYIAPWRRPYSMDDRRKEHWWNIREKLGLYLCQDCNIVFRYWEYYVKHSAVHSRGEGKKFSCICGKDYENSDIFNSHLIEKVHLTYGKQ